MIESRAVTPGFISSSDVVSLLYRNTWGASRPGNPDPDTEADQERLIPFPCCPKEKVAVFPGAHGKTSSKCPTCGRYAIFDCDLMTAEPGKACRGAARRMRTRN